MLKLVLPPREYTIETPEGDLEFRTTPEATLLLEHSLISISKWEAKYKKPFLSSLEQKTREESLYYVKCMTLNKTLSDDIYTMLTDEDIVKMQMSAILAANPQAKVMAMSSAAHQGTLDVLRELNLMIQEQKKTETASEKPEEEAEENDIPVITLELKEQKHRAHHQRYQKGERGAVVALNAEDEAEDFED